MTKVGLFRAAITLAMVKVLPEPVLRFPKSGLYTNFVHQINIWVSDQSICFVIRKQF